MSYTPNFVYIQLINLSEPQCSTRNNPSCVKFINRGCFPLTLVIEREIISYFIYKLWRRIFSVSSKIYTVSTLYTKVSDGWLALSFSLTSYHSL